MKDQLSVQNFLKRKYDELSARNPRYSLRAFSKRIGMTSGAVSEIFRGTRRVTRKAAAKIADNLGLDPLERNEILRHFEDKPKRIKARTREEEQIASDYARVGTDQFKLIAHWLHMAILNFTYVKDFRPEPEFIAERFGVTVGDARDAIERLARLKLIEIKPDGSFVRTSKKVYTTDDKQSEAIQQAHLSDMRRAEKALENIPVEFRDFTALTFTGNPSQIAKAKEIIRKLQDEVADTLQEGEQPEVYKLSVYLYPLTSARRKA